MKKYIFPFLTLLSLLYPSYAQSSGQNKKSDFLNTTEVLRDISATMDKYEKNGKVRKLDDITYRVSTADNTATIVSGAKSGPTILSIPEKIEISNIQYTVVGIEGRAFANDKRLTKLIVPRTVIFIGPDAFRGCSSLEECSFSEGLEVIFDKAFYGTNLCEYIFPESLKVIGTEAFGREIALKEASSSAIIVPVHLPDGIKEIGKNAFTQYLGTGIARTEMPTFCTMLSVPDKFNLRSLAKIGLSVSPAQGTGDATSFSGFIQKQLQQQVQDQSVTATVNVSDVDRYIPLSKTDNDKLFAVIICNEDYQSVSSVPYAKNDGHSFLSYCKQTLGIPEKNIHLRENATLNNILSELLWLKKVCEAYQGEASALFYYAGHGIPDEVTNDSYILPVDGDATIIRSAYKMSELYGELSSMNSKLTLVFMDACFSGSLRGNGMLASARGVALNAKPETPKGKMVVFSAASGNETAYPYDEQNHGLFTYFLLKNLQSSNGSCTLGELYDFISRNVRQQSIVTKGKSQSPTISVSVEIDNWEKIRLR